VDRNGSPVAFQRLELGDCRCSVRNRAGVVCCHGDLLMESNPIQLVGETGALLSVLRG
jgi:hypothetical protein